MPPVHKDAEQRLDELDARLGHIERLISQIKWTLVGAVMLFALQTVGLKGLLKNILL